MKHLTLLILIISCPLVFFAQEKHWITIEEEDFEELSLALKIQHQPSLADEEWISVVINNKTKEDFLIQKARYQVNCSVFEKNGDLVSEGSFTSYNPNEFLDDMTGNLLSEEKIKQGTSTISQYPSAYGAAILKMPKDKYYKVKATIFLSLDLVGKQNMSIQWEDINFEFDWYRPNERKMKGIQNRLQNLLQTPQIHPYHHHTLATLLQIDEISEKVTLQQLIAAKEKRHDFADGRIALVRHLNDKFKNEQVLKDHYFDKIKNHDVYGVNDLVEATDIWDKRYLEPLQAWYNKSNIGIMFRIMDILYPRQQQWKKENISRALSDTLLAKYGDILFAVPDDLSDQDFIRWSSLAAILGKTGDPSAVGILCPFLSCKRQVLSQDIQIDPESMALPRPYRAKDLALDAILRLQNKNLENEYSKAGFKPPYYYGEIYIVTDRIRNQMIEQLRKENACDFKSN